MSMLFGAKARLARSAVALLVVALAACGGGGGTAGDPVLGAGGGTTSGTAPSALADLSLVLDKSNIANTGAETVTVTVTALAAGNVALIGSAVPVSFTVDKSGNQNETAVITPGGAATDTATGKQKATVELGTDHSNRTVTVNVTAGSVTRSISFNVVDSIVNTPKASDLSLVLDKTNVGNSGSEVVKVTVTAVDALRNVIAGIPVTVTVDNKATVAPSGKQTDAFGKVTADVQIGDDKSNRLVTVTVKSDTLVRTASFLVTGAKLQGTALPSLPTAGSAGNKVDYRLSDVNQSPMVGIPVVVSGPGLTGATGTTDANGAYTFTYTAPATPGPIDITATAGGATSLVTVTVPSGVSSVPAANVTVSSASLSASPTVVRVNTTDTANRSEIRALFLGASNAAVKNVRVRFDLNGDVNSIGGTLSSGTSLVYSDASGAAVTSYLPGTRSSPTDGVTVRACWDYNDFAAGTCPNQVLTKLTVVSDPLSVTIGTDDKIEDGASTLTYVKKYVLLVVDAAGNPKSDVQITPSLDLTGYYKGYYRWVAANSAWVSYHLQDGVETLGTALSCAAEDLNRNGSIDVGEDKNNNGQLDPRKSDVSISMVGSTKTDSNGTAILKIEYPKSIAGWIDFRISASAFGVLSPPATYSGILPVSASALKTETPPPAFVNSPYGRNRKTSDAVYCTNTD